MRIDMVTVSEWATARSRRPKRRLQLGPTLLGLWLLCASPPVFAGVVKQLSLPQLVDHAPLIVRGTVVAQQPVVAESGTGLVAMLSEVRIREVLKGKAPAGPLLLRQPGGAYGGVVQTVAGAARFREGEDVVLFLEPARDDASVHLVLGMAAGKFRLERSATGEMRAVQDLDGLMAYDGDSAKNEGPRLRVLGKRDAGNAEALLNEIRTLAKGRAP